VPPGWDEWDVAGNGYPEYDYNLLENAQIKHYGKSPADYLTDVVSAKAQNFVTKSIKDRKPFLVEVATFAPHARTRQPSRTRTSSPTSKLRIRRRTTRCPATHPPGLLPGRR
jgi:N-acetylglucosamine-6-sulfatase